MSTPHSTLVSEILAEYNARPEANAGPSTPKEVHARMIQMVNAANGLRYELARFGDIERQLKAIHERMESLVLKAKELNDLICERVSQASQPWAIHESEELLQKVQQLERENAEQCVLLGKGGERECALLGKVERLERENAELRRDVYQCPPTSENGYEGLKWSDAFEVLERDNAALRDDRNELRTALFAQQKQQSESNREWAQESAELKIRLGVLERENAALREKMKVSWDEISVLVNQNSELRRDVYQCPPTSENDYEGFKWADAFDVIEHNNAKLHNEVTALKRENLSLREARKPVAVPGLHGLVTWYADAQQLGEAFQREREKCIRFEEVMQSQGDEIRRLTAENDALHKTLSAAIDAARKEDQP